MALRLRFRPLLLVAFAAAAGVGCGSESVNAPVEVDVQPPVMVWLVGPDEPVNPGEDIPLRFFAQDNVGIERVGIRVNGAFVLLGTWDLTQPLAQFTGIWNVPVPEGVRLDVPTTVTLIVFDKAGLTAEGEASVQLVDSRGPSARLDLGGLHGDGTIRSGETLDIYVNAADNQQLEYLGYDVAGMRDSVRASGIGDSHAFRLTVPPSWVLQRPAMRAWARDATGRVSGTNEREVQVYNWVDHPIVSIPVLADLSVRQVLWDPKRNTIYQLRSGEENARIEGVDLVTGVRIAPIPLPAGSFSLAFSGSGDSLAVAIRNERALGVVELLKPVRATTVVPLQYDGDPYRMPWAIQSSGAHFFVALSSGADFGRLLDVNLGTGAQVIRTDIDGGTQVPSEPILLALPGGRLFVGSTGYAYFGSDDRFLYSPETDRFTRTTKLGPLDPRYYVTSPSGRLMYWNDVFNAALDSLGHVPMRDWAYPNAVALTPDGEAVYQATNYGYQKIRVSDGLLLEQVKLPAKPLFLIAPDGNRLIAVAESAVMIVDLR